jgi:hypothetical protein
MERKYWASLFFSGGSDFSVAVRELEERGIAGLEAPQVYGPPFAPDRNNFPIVAPRIETDGA